MTTDVCCENASTRRKISLSQIFWSLLAYKLLYLGAISLALITWPERTDSDIFHSARQKLTSSGYLTFSCHFASWDAEHYLFIADHGYEAGAGRCAFYPLFPFTIRLCSRALGCNSTVVGLILSNLFSLCSFLLFFCIVERRFGHSIATTALLLLVSFPGSLFFQFTYSESLFFLLLMLLVSGLQRHGIWLPLAAAFLLPLTRAVGVFCLVPLCYGLLSTLGNLFKKRLSPKDVLVRGQPSGAERSHKQVAPLRSLALGSLAKQIPLLVSVSLGWFTYLLLMKKWTGNAFEGFAAQKQFGLQSFDNLFAVSSFLKALITPTSFHDVDGSVVDRCAFLLLLYSLPILWRIDREGFVYTISFGIVPAMSGMFVSYTRFLAVVFPVFIAGAFFFNMGRQRRLLPPIVFTFTLLQAILVWRFLNFKWAG